MQSREAISVLPFPAEVPAVRRQPIRRYDPMTTPSKDVSFAQASDDVLITLFQNGDQRAFRVLVERYQERIRNLLFSIFHEPDFVDDLSQEVFVKVYEALPGFRFESSLYTWLYRIAVNKSRDELRRRKLRRFFSFQSLDDGTLAELETRMAHPPKDHESADLVTYGLRALPDHQRIVVILKDIEGFSYEEIADILQIEVGTVKSRLSRARTTLKNILGPIIKERIA